MIEIKNLSKSFGKNIVLSDINISFERGRVYGIVGENGAGKTTLFNCISGLEPYEGIISCNYGVLKDKLGYLQTESFFFSKMTGREYLQLLCSAREISAMNFEENNIFELPLDHYADTYSTGMKKKLALTAILMQKNFFYILDEPFNGVDIQSNIVITELINRLKKSEKTVLISSHIFSTLNDTCDEIFVLKDGNIEKNVKKEDFSLLENEMKAFLNNDKIDKIEF